MNETLKRIGELIRTQDNRCTDAPIFIVEQKRRIYGLDKDYTDDIVWVDEYGDQNEVSDEKELAKIEAAVLEGDEEFLEGYTEVGYLDIWEFVTACFTEQGCIDYLEINGHNLKEPRIYAAGSYRNNEFRAVRDYLKELE